MSDSTSPTAPDAAGDDAAAANLRRVRAMYDAAPPEGSDDGDRTPALHRVLASLAGGYSTSDLDPRDVRALVVVCDDAHGIIDALNSQLSSARATLARLRAPAADVAAIGARAAAAREASANAAAVFADWARPGDQRRADEARAAAAEASAADVPALLALLAAEREGRVAEVAGARAAALREARRACEARAMEYERDPDGSPPRTGDLAAEADECSRAILALATKGAPDV